VANDLIFHLVLANLTGAAAILAALALRGPARAQFGAGLAYALWLIVPAAMLASLFPARTVLLPAPVATPDPLVDLTQGFAASPAIPHSPAADAPLDMAAILIGVWLAGVAGSLILLAIGQRRALARFGEITADAKDPDLARAANPSVGPALIGVVRPRVVVPNDFETRFAADERAMILAHERTHLALGHASINGLAALLQAVSWFNPLVHVAARCARVDQELACDAAVVGRFPRARQTYAHALLKTQLAYTPLPLGCDWPVRSASLLEKRIEMLAQQKPGRVRLLGGAAFVAALTATAGVAAWSAEPTHVRFAATPAPQAVLPRPSPAPASDDAAKTSVAVQTAIQALAEPQAPAEPKPVVLAQASGPAAPQRAAPPPAASGPAGNLDRYVGAYQITRYGSMIVTRQGDTLVLQPQPGPPPEPYLRGSDGVWTGAQSGQRVTFHEGPDGRILDLTFENGPVPGTMRRRPDGEAEKLAAELAARVKAQTADPRAEGVIRELIRRVLDGSIDIDRFFGERAAVQARALFPSLQNDWKSLGDLKSLTFHGVGIQGGDQFIVTFANGQREFRVILDAQGRIDTMNNPSNYPSG
jgi:beta-lactamase regulating signal transducer with metallopeptidase domain